MYFGENLIYLDQILADFEEKMLHKFYTKISK